MGLSPPSRRCSAPNSCFALSGAPQAHARLRRLATRRGSATGGAAGGGVASRPSRALLAASVELLATYALPPRPLRDRRARWRWPVRSALAPDPGALGAHRCFALPTTARWRRARPLDGGEGTDVRRERPTTRPPRRSPRPAAPTTARSPVNLITQDQTLLGHPEHPPSTASTSTSMSSPTAAHKARLVVDDGGRVDKSESAVPAALGAYRVRFQDNFSHRVVMHKKNSPSISLTDRHAVLSSLFALVHVGLDDFATVPSGSAAPLKSSTDAARCSDSRIAAGML